MTPERARELASRRPTAGCEVTLEPEQLAAFAERGFLPVPRITSDEELVWLGEVYDALFAERRGSFRGGYFDLSRPYDSEGPDRLPQVILPELALPALRETAFWRNGRALAARLLGARVEELQGWGHMIRKPPRIGEGLPWHQDEAYWDPAFDYRALGCWMALDPATPETGCMRFIPGSHRGGVREHRHIADDPSIHGLETEDVDDTLAVLAPAPPGGAIFHHCRILHSSLPNRSEQVRRGYANEWQLPPVRRDEPHDRPWVHAGKRAWDSRRIYEAAGREPG
jgi:hypothetical protein